MLKRVISCLILAATPLGAQASTDLAQQWGQEATRLSVETSEMIFAVDLGQDLDISETYALDVYRFGRTSSDLARWIDESKGPNDLGCIFRGMAAESEDQLVALESPAELRAQRESLRRLASMFSDAEMIAVAAQRRAPTPGLLGATLSCAADSSAALDALR